MAGQLADAMIGELASRESCAAKGKRVWRSRVVQIGEAVTRRKSHFATCPQANQHRRKQ